MNDFFFYLFIWNTILKTEFLSFIQMGIKLNFESKLYIVEKDQSTLPDDERSISRNVAET